MNPRFPRKLEAPPTDAELLREAAKWSPTSPANMTNKHTPGPWAVESNRRIITDAFDKPVCYFYPRDNGSDAANARLIAAAPALLSFAERVLARWHTHDGQIDRIDDLLAALAAATGEEPEAISRESQTAAGQLLRHLYGEDDSE